MADQPPQSNKTKIEDAQSLASPTVASMNTQGSKATISLLDTNPFLIPQSPFKLPMRMMPSSATNPTSVVRGHDPPQDGAEFDHTDVKFLHIADHLQQRGTHDKSEVEIPRQNAQPGAKLPVQIELPNTFAEDAKPQDTSSSDDLSDPEDIDSDFRMSPEVEEPVDRLEKYAFNYAGQAYDHRVPQHLARGTTLFAKKLQQNRTISQHLEWAEEQDGYNACPDLVPNTVERERGPKTVECVWVGMLPNSRDDHEDAASNSVQPKPRADSRSSAALYNEPDPSEGQLDGPSKASKTAPKRPKNGLSIVDLEDDQLDVITYSPSALRVVAKVSTNPAVKSWFLYAMTSLQSNSSLCQGWKVHFEEVFFFKAFRDDTATGYMKRRHATNAKIKAVIFPADLASALAPQSPASVDQSTMSVPLSSLSPSPDSGSLPIPESPGEKGKSAQKAVDLISEQAPNTGDVQNVPDQSGRDAAKPVDSVQDSNTSISEKKAVAGSEPNDIDKDHLERDLPEPTYIVHKDDGGDDDAYPEYAISSTNRAYTDFVDIMMRELSGVESTDTKAAEKRKRVTFEPSEEQVANKRRKTGGNPGSNEYMRGGEDGAESESASLVAQQDTEHLIKKLTSLITKLAVSQDTAGLRQCVTMMECIEKRGRPGPKSALAPYLSVSSSKDTDSGACCGKLREILVGFSGPRLHDF